MKFAHSIKIKHFWQFIVFLSDMLIKSHQIKSFADVTKWKKEGKKLSLSNKLSYNSVLFEEAKEEKRKIIW
jgi:hypothetical protein